MISKNHLPNRNELVINYIFHGSNTLGWINKYDSVTKYKDTEQQN